MSQAFRILSQLNPTQQEAVTYNKGPLLILAGAGSGKTRALTYKVAYLVNKKGVSPRNIILITFTNRAANEMKKRIKNLLVGQPLPFAGTFHSFCAQILRRESKFAGLPNNFLIYDEHDQQMVVKNAMTELGLSPKKIRPSSVLSTISQAKNELIDALEYDQYARGYFQKTVAQIFPVYQKLLREYRALDFDDLLLNTVRLLQKEKEVLGKYQNKFRHVLVDEYQDTNRAQYELTKLLTGRWRNLCVVGDCSQSIYSWRGADYHNVLNLKSDFPDLKVINLEQNYRSTKTILQAANQVITKNSSHPVLNLWTKNKEGTKIVVHQANNELEEALFVVKIIKSSPSGSFAVLYRTNAQSRVLEEALLHTGLPYILVGGTRFYERKEVKDCLAYLRLIANPSDFVSYQRICKLGKRRLTKFFDFSEKSKTKKYSTLELLDKIMKATGYQEIYNKKKGGDLARLENIKELRSVATRFPDLKDFLENVSLIQKESLPIGSPATKGQKKLLRNNSPHNIITLTTIHAAKGTEFTTVFLIGMEEGLFPHSRSALEKEGLEEERRLCYVGMTRAKEKLYLTHTQRRLYFGRRLNNPVSRFLKDIPDNLIEYK